MSQHSSELKERPMVVDVEIKHARTPANIRAGDVFFGCLTSKGVRFFAGLVGENTAAYGACTRSELTVDETRRTVRSLSSQYNLHAYSSTDVKSKLGTRRGARQAANSVACRALGHGVRSQPDSVSPSTQRPSKPRNWSATFKINT
jgi:hypothetical protein